MKKKVCCVGLLTCDIPLKPVPKDILERDNGGIETPVWSPGGDAANAAITLARLGFSTSLTALAGKDIYGDYVVNYLSKAGVDTRNVTRHPSLGTSVSHILIEENGERHFLVCSPINSELAPEHLSDECLLESDLVYIGSSLCLKGLDSGGSAALFKKARSMGKITATDFGCDDINRGDYWLRFLEPLLKETDILLPSYREAVVLTGEKELPKIRDALAPFGSKILAVKLGNKGCYITDFKDEWNLPVFDEFEPVDTTGAGDSFGAGFVCAYLSGWTPEACALFASAVAGFNVTKVGATGGIPDFQTAYNFVTERSGAGRFPV